MITLEAVSKSVVRILLPPSASLTDVFRQCIEQRLCFRDLR